MNRLIIQFLNRCCHINKNKIVCYDGNLISVLTSVFGLTKKQLKPYVRSWARKKDKSFDFNKFWNPPKINCQWTVEMAQDLEAFHGIDVEAELSSMLAREIDREMLNNLFRLSGQPHFVSSRAYEEINL